jgi:hypothetical protein
VSVSRSAALSSRKRATTDAMTAYEARRAVEDRIGHFAALPSVSYWPIT